MSQNPSTWRLRRLTPGPYDFTISHPWITNAPGCPDDRHPTRWCKCKVHRSQEAAEKYITEQEAQA